MQGVTKGFTIVVCKDADDAVEKGHDYKKGETRLNIKTAVIVQKGTEDGHATVDLVMIDEKGKKYVTLVTASLLKGLVKVCA
jgi:hypothetical protein